MEVNADRDASRIRDLVRRQVDKRQEQARECPEAPGTPIREIASRYDVRNLRAADMDSLSQELYSIGAIGFQDRALLSLQGTDLPDQQLRDYIEIWQETVCRHESFGVNRQAVQRAERLLKILLHIDQLHRASGQAISA